ncbi:uncharacterized protein LOC134206589 [Armigeres subalbatus]|uniref:uncharacterized protein LOC134206589 n=1 Tax=Armigeres subalbatus TaxID=124917 RepID=UPI002ED32C6B
MTNSSKEPSVIPARLVPVTGFIPPSRRRKKFSGKRTRCKKCFSKRVAKRNALRDSSVCFVETCENHPFFRSAEAIFHLFRWTKAAKSIRRSEQVSADRRTPFRRFDEDGSRDTANDDDLSHWRPSFQSKGILAAQKSPH